MRQNRVSWFKGRIHTVRITPSVLAPSQFLTVPAQVIALWPEGVPGRKPTPAPNSSSMAASPTFTIRR